MRKKVITILTIILLLLMIFAIIDTYDKLNFKEENMNKSDVNIFTTVFANNPSIEDNEAQKVENTPLQSADEIEMEAELRETILNYHKIDSRLGKPLEKPEIISYGQIGREYTVTTSGYYSFGLDICEPIDYTFFAEKNSNDDFVVKSWNGRVFGSKASYGMELKDFFDMKEGFKKDSNYSEIYEVLFKNARKYYTGVNMMHIIHYKKMSDTKYEVGIIDKFDYGVSTPMWESRVFLIQKNDSSEWNEIDINTFIPDDWNKVFSKSNSWQYVFDEFRERGKRIVDFKVENADRASDNKITAIVSFYEVMSDDTKGKDNLKRMAEVNLEQNKDGEWIALSMKELD